MINKEKRKRLWITWEIQRRNKSLSQKLNAKLFELVVNLPRLFKYPLLIFKSSVLLYKEKPSILFVQNPSIVLAFFSVITKKSFSIKTLVIDTHNAGLFPLEGESKLLGYIAKFVIKRADAILITNPVLFDYVVMNGGKPFIIPDPLPDLVPEEAKNSNKEPLEIKKATFICTWSGDEPYKELIEAANSIKDELDIYITGKYRSKADALKMPDNVFLTGFLKDNEYVNQLSISDFLIVLTKRENCLNCGAYEAVSLNKPMLISDTDALKVYFNKGAIFSENDSDSLLKSLKIMLKTLKHKKLEIHELNKELSQKYQDYLVPLESFLKD